MNLICNQSSAAGGQRLKEMDINIVETTETGKDFSVVSSEDVVILPAFGASYQEMKLLNERSVHIVDTTCPWVSLLSIHTKRKGSLTLNPKSNLCPTRHDVLSSAFQG